MKIKKLWSIIWKIIGGLLVVFGIIDYSLKWGIFKAIGDFFVFLWSLRIPDIFLLILTLGILVWIIFLHRKVRGFSGGNIKEILSENKRFIDINDELRENLNNILSDNKNLMKENHLFKSEMKVEIEKLTKKIGLLKSKTEEAKKEPKKEPSLIEEFRKLPKYHEYIHILFTLGDEDGKSLKQTELRFAYGNKFSDNLTFDFNVMINYLNKEGYIVSFPDGVTDEISWEITSKGLVLIENVDEAEKSF